MDKMVGPGRYHRHVPLGSRPPRIIVAEDDADVRRLVAVALRPFGYEIIEARTGAELLDAIGDNLLSEGEGGRPDVIISDIRMPGLTGLEILAGLRQVKWSTIFVLMTAFADRETREEARRLGADAFFAKPFDVDDLMTAVINMAPGPVWPGRSHWHLQPAR